MQNNIHVIETNNTSQTFEFAKELGRKAEGGQLFLLSGDLGTGKTVFAQGFAEGLGIDDYINSPTFTIMQMYEGGRIPFYHFDVYIIGDPSEMDELGYEDYFFGNGVCLVEWAELIEELLPEDAIWITVEKDLEKGFDYRRITVKGSVDI